ncbi:MAG: hypothetical protein JWR13_757 [Mycobacterium sp.]|nr:hypothetical protein [Mycobacterium sp.]
MGASAVAALAARHSSKPTTRGIIRPNRSDSGPKTSCPNAIPMRNAVSVNCTDVAVVSRSVVISGKAERYRSVAALLASVLGDDPSRIGATRDLLNQLRDAPVNPASR